ncbi:thiaminase II [Rhodovulum sp. DZ06]|uniref:thiaminase II n=1 Tax=Rhodovulum sp. DZ06 TaxID=3425126 RepID=UPI003D34145D
MRPAPEYGEAFERLRAGAGEAWGAYADHAFVRGLGDGTLPRAAFLHYLAQDYVFLIHFSRAWGLAAAKAGTLEEMKHCAATLDALVNHEMALHIETCAAAGISAAALEATAERPENLAYTRYVLEAGYSGDFLDLLCALAPCVLGYGEIGARLSATKTSDAYAGWIDVYGGEEYQQVCRDMGALLDGALARRLGEWEASPRAAQLQARFDMATKLEAAFWDMGLQP